MHLHGAQPGLRRSVEHLSHVQAAQLQRYEIIGRVDGDDAVVVIGPALGNDKSFVASLGVSVEVHPPRCGTVVVLNQPQCHVVGLLQLGTPEIIQLFCVQRERPW